MHRFWGHLFDLTNITSGTSNFDLTPVYLSKRKEVTDEIEVIEEWKKSPYLPLL